MKTMSILVFVAGFAIFVISLPSIKTPLRLEHNIPSLKYLAPNTYTVSDSTPKLSAAAKSMEQQLQETEKYLAENDVYDRIKQFESVPEEYYRAITLKQSLIEKISEIEIASSQKLITRSLQ